METVGHDSVEINTHSQAAHPSLLSGKIFDETGGRLIPSHARKGNKRYRYYVTPADSPGSPIRLPANEIEQLVRKAVMDWATEAKRVVDAVGWSDAKLAEEAIAAGKKLALSLGKSNTNRDSEKELASCIESVQVGPHDVRISIDLVGCGMVKAGTDIKSVQLEVAAERKRCGMAVRLVVGGGNNGRVSEPDQTLIQLVNKARDWLDRLTRMGHGISEIAKAEDVSPGYVTRLLHLALLAPDITQSIAVGDHPADVNATRMMQALPLPLDWGEQRELLGMT
jgi:site-specific DNA recombinase